MNASFCGWSTICLPGRYSFWQCWVLVRSSDVRFLWCHECAARLKFLPSCVQSIVDVTLYSYCQVYETSVTFTIYCMRDVRNCKYVAYWRHRSFWSKGVVRFKIATFHAYQIWRCEPLWTYTHTYIQNELIIAARINYYIIAIFCLFICYLSGLFLK